MKRISIKSEPSASGIVSGNGQGLRMFGGGGGRGGRGGKTWLSELLKDLQSNRQFNNFFSVGAVTIVNPEPNNFVSVGAVTTVNPEPNNFVSVGVVTTVNPEPNQVDKEEEEDDDDCVILDGDPEQMNLVETDSIGDGNSDEVEVVGTRGEIACRDFPHSRHLCANYLFGSTPHEVHCHMCHCYVCDSPAPCSHWGTGMLVFDHCHATDKEENWKKERNMLKNGAKAPTSSSILIDCNNPPPLNPELQPDRVYPGRVLQQPHHHYSIQNLAGRVLQQPHHHHYSIQNPAGGIIPILQVTQGVVQPNFHNQNTLHQVNGGGFPFKRLGRASLPHMNHPYAHQRSHFPSSLRARTQIPQPYQQRMPYWPNTEPEQSYFLASVPQTQLNTAGASTSTAQPGIMNQIAFSPQLLEESLNPSFQQNMGNLDFPYTLESSPVITGWNGNGLESHFDCEASSSAAPVPPPPPPAAPAISPPPNNYVLGIGSAILSQDPFGSENDPWKLN